MTTRTFGSASAASIDVTISATISAVIELRSCGLLSVSVAMPSLTS